MPGSKNGASGGDALRLMRLRQGLRQADLEVDEIITQANYSMIERGLSAPSRVKLDAILDILQASYQERQDILTHFGYAPPTPLPTEGEMDTMRTLCQPTLDALPVPAYAVDMITRLIAANELFNKLIGEGDLLRRLLGQPLFMAQFAGMRHLANFMDEMEPHLLETVRMIRYRLAPYAEEQWYGELVEEMCAEPAFRHYWQASDGLEPPEPAQFDFADTIVHPASFDLPDAEGVKLSFHAHSEKHREDDRLVIVYLLAADPLTMRQIARWRTA